MGQIDPPQAIEGPASPRAERVKNVNIFYFDPPLGDLRKNIFDPKIISLIFYRAPYKTLSKNIFNKKGGMTHPNEKVAYGACTIPPLRHFFLQIFKMRICLVNFSGFVNISEDYEYSFFSVLCQFQNEWLINKSLKCNMS